MEQSARKRDRPVLQSGPRTEQCIQAAVRKPRCSTWNIPLRPFHVEHLALRRQNQAPHSGSREWATSFAAKPAGNSTVPALASKTSHPPRLTRHAALSTAACILSTARSETASKLRPAGISSTRPAVDLSNNSQRTDRLTKEAGLLPLRLRQRDVNLRPAQRNRNSRKSRHPIRSRAASQSPAADAGRRRCTPQNAGAGHPQDLGSPSD